MVVPFDGEDIAAGCSILDPCALLLLLPEACPFEISVSAMRLENDCVIHDDLLRIIFLLSIIGIPFRFVE